MPPVSVFPASQHQLSSEVRERLERLETSQLSDCLDRMAAAAGIHLLSGAKASMIGTAVTVKTRPGDNLAVHVGLELATAGSVLVIDGGGVCDNALLGDVLATYAHKRGLSGVVVDGAVRDRDALLDMALPVYARTTTPRGPYRSGPGTVHGAVCLGGTVVSDGDVVVGDADGVVIVPAAALPDVLDAAEEVQRAEARHRKAILANAWDRNWIRSHIEPALPRTE